MNYYLLKQVEFCYDRKSPFAKGGETRKSPFAKGGLRGILEWDLKAEVSNLAIETCIIGYSVKDNYAFSGRTKNKVTI